jgi:hypothetical protein
MMSSQFKVGTYYYLKDLKHVYFACQGFSYGKKDQTLFFHDEPNKAFRNSHCNGLFIESFKSQKMLRNKV